MARTAKPLTNTQVEKSKPKIRDGKLVENKLIDGDGLYLAITPKNSKIWRFNYYKPHIKKRTETAIGKYPQMSLAQARKVRDEYLALLAQNIDPQTYKQNLLEQKELTINHTFRTVCEKWFTEIYPSKALNEETRAKNWARLENHIFPKLADVPLSEITPRLLIETYHSIGASNTLDKIHRLVKATLDYGIKLGIIDGHNCNLAKDDFIAPLAKGHPAINPDELPELLNTMNKAFDDGRLEPNTLFAFNLTLLTD